MTDGELQGKNNKSPQSKSGGAFKWFVLVTYVIYSASLAMSELIYAPVPKQTAAYYGIKGKYFDNYIFR